MEPGLPSVFSPPRKKRGRPRHNEDEAHDSVKVRREKNREAQRLLKARRLAEWTDREKQIYQLEKTIESMGDVILTLADDILSSSFAQHDAALVRKLRDSIQETLAFMHGSKPPECRQDCVKDANANLPSSTQAAAPNAPSNAATELALNRGLDQHRSPSTPWLAQQAPGSEWMLGILSLGSSPDAFIPSVQSERDFIGFQLVHSTLQFAYNVLRGTVDVSTGLAASIFGYSLRSHSREQLLSKLVWSLGPGFSGMHDLVVCAADHVLDSYSNDMPPDPLAVDSQSTRNAQVFHALGPTVRHSLIDANGIVGWLVSMNVHRLDPDTLQLSLGGSATSAGTHPIPEYSKARHSFFNANALLPLGLPGSSKLKPHETTHIQISQSALFRHLSEVSVCTGSGLAYHREHLDRIIFVCAGLQQGVQV
ncbi:hypothetical protein QBC46DRAFT_66750 [Diplogelasinospora grovesii]|uniref:BZIP domain-containing protein n=1 Tax=Diplogelasinospora grovesii TaxID=303347 RepID=A0AAN6NCY1_9PEZI|nr:hypothetical protein QBC46DRAFT_66750 [Diplogelasinospora grovesii]